MKYINIGLVGFGNVGRGVYNIINKNKKIYNMMGFNIKIPKICVKDIHKDRNIDSNTIFTSNYKCLTNDNNIDIIVEVMGGIDKPYEIMKDTINSKKKFVTANKALVANKLEYISNNNNILYEASVAGGIPIIETLKTQFYNDNIYNMNGIINGTNNYILTKMDKENKNYEDVIVEAQENGFAEAEPSSDVMGYDARSKLIILAYHMDGIIINEKDIYTDGINNITKEDFIYAKQMNCTIKHIANYNNDNNNINCNIMPVFVSNNNLFSQIDNETNIIDIDSIYNNNTIMIGKGAGMYPTALSVVKDILNINTTNNTKYSITNYTKSFDSKFFIRINGVNRIGLLKDISNQFFNYKVSIANIISIDELKTNNITFGIITDNVNINNVSLLMLLLKNKNIIKDYNIFKYFSK